jgi:hypothetical protein
MTDIKHEKPAERTPDEVVLLEDLAPRKDVRGGAAKLRFGESTRKGQQGRGDRGI